MQSLLQKYSFSSRAQRRSLAQTLASRRGGRHTRTRKAERRAVRVALSKETVRE